MRTHHFFIKAITSALLASPILACSLAGNTDESALTGTHDGGSGSDAGACTLTQGYWKNHPDAWPLASLQLGARSYAKLELIAILKTPVKGNGLVALAHQLIAAKLNVAAGASDVDVELAIGHADALIGSLVVPPVGDGKLKTSVTAELAGSLDAFNNGNTGPGHCDDHGNDSGDDDEDSDSCGHGSDCGHDDDGDDCGCDGSCNVPVCGNGKLEVGELCDDGNTAPGDGCSATCTIEVPVCGNGKVEAGETCDDGNTANGDGCSSVCICEPCH